MVAADTRRGKYLTATSIFRGRMSTREVETSLKLIKDKNSEHFVNWIPDNAKIAICDIPPRHAAFLMFTDGPTRALT